ncbi:MAG: hypothetical protein H8D78_06245 [Chloroflexi bacterium]|nr:hypothetical protein [Chloroflexota bacterium]
MTEQQSAPESPKKEEWWGEKDEKEEEKQHEKEEKPRDMAEKWRQDPLSAIVWAAVLIVGGLALILDNLDVPVFRGNGWSIALLCAGLIVGLEAVVRLLMPEYRRPIRGTLILAAVLVGLGLSGWIGWGVTWALVIIAIGVSMLLTGLRRGR